MTGYKLLNEKASSRLYLLQASLQEASVHGVIFPVYISSGAATRRSVQKG